MLRFFEKHLNLLESNVCCFWNRWCTNQWVTVWLEFLGTLFTLSFSFLSVWAAYSSLQISAGLVGLLLSYAVQVPSNLGWLLKLFVQAEVEFISLERIIEYMDLTGEEDRESIQDSSYWPLKSNISLQNLKMKYSNDSDYTLKGLDINISERSKVAIIGRTAAGKSSLFSALLKYYPFEGEINIDGKNISNMDLRQVRRAVRMIPQTAKLFGDSLKEALCGPLQSSTSDSKVWNVLEQVQMKSVIQELEYGLHTNILETEFSAGQKQLLCLARAILNPVIEYQ